MRAFAPYLAALAVLGVICYLKPLPNWDALPYAVLALTANHTDPLVAHRQAYREAAEVVRRNPSLAPMIYSDRVRPRMDDPVLFNQQLPFYRIRILYIWVLALLMRLGLSPLETARLVSASGYFAVGVVIFAWIRHYAGNVAPLLAAAMMVSVPLTDLGRAMNPDSLSVAILLGAMYLVFVKNLATWGLGLLGVSLFVRTDNLLLALLVAGYLAVTSKVRWWMMALYGIVVTSVVIATNQFSGNYGLVALWGHSFWFLGLAEKGFSVSDYLKAATWGAARLRESALFDAAIFFLAVASQVRHSMTAVAGLSFAFAALHFVLFPSAEIRHYVLAIIMAFISVIAMRGPARFDMESEGDAAPDVQAAVPRGKRLPI